MSEPKPLGRIVGVWSTCLLVISLVLLPVRLDAQEGSESADVIQYVVDLSEARKHMVQVEMVVPVAGETECELMMATWTPGSYLIREYARNIDAISFTTPEGEALEFEKTVKNRWKVACGEQDSIHVRYSLYCQEMSVRTNFVDDQFAVLNGAATFLTKVGSESLPHRVRVKLLEGWSRSVAAMATLPGSDPNAYEAVDFDQLVDSPIIAGDPEVFPFTVNGHEHWLVNLGDEGLWDGAAAAKDVARIVAEEQALWGTVPYERYMFLNVIGESGGGLEHNQSTLLLTSRWSFRSGDAYLRWLGLVTHEFFHTWNVRTMRPKALVRYDYENENYFDSLWIAEGITSYYDELLLPRSGVATQAEYLDKLSGQIRNVQQTPGRLVQSLRDSSHDTWIKFYRQDKHSPNAQISYYVKGAVVAFLLDAKIRAETGNAKSLDDVMRRMYAEFSGDRGYEEDDFRRVAGEVAGVDLASWFDVHVDQAVELDYQEALDWLGLEFVPEPAVAEPKDEIRATQKGDSRKPWAGWVTSDHDGRLVVDRVVRDSPAYEAGVNVDDEVIAINEFRVSSKNLDRVLGEVGLGREVSVTLARRGVIQERRFVIQEEPRKSWKLRVVKEPTEEQKENLKQWLASSQSQP